MRAIRVKPTPAPLGPQLSVRLRQDDGNFLEGQIAALAS